MQAVAILIDGSSRARSEMRPVAAKGQRQRTWTLMMALAGHRR